MIDKYEQALLDGREVVVTIPDSRINSSIYWMEQVDDNHWEIWLWTRALGYVKTSQSLEEVARFMENLVKNSGAEIIICGAED